MERGAVFDELLLFPVENADIVTNIMVANEMMKPWLPRIFMLP
jgi:hypothetical protein